MKRRARALTPSAIQESHRSGAVVGRVLASATPFRGEAGAVRKGVSRAVDAACLLLHQCAAPGIVRASQNRRRADR